MSHIKPAVTDEMVEQLAALLPPHEYRVDVAMVPYCTCGWSAEHYCDVGAYDRHVASVSLEAAAPRMYAAALESMAEHIGPDDGLLMTPAEVKHRLRWQADQLRRDA